MTNRFYIAHEIPGRIRIIVPALSGRKDHKTMEKLFLNVKGIKHVRIEPLIHSVLIEYDDKVIYRNAILRYISLLVYQSGTYSPFDNLLPHVKQSVRKDLLYSLITGALLFISLMRKKAEQKPDMLDYLVMISSAHTVLTHGGKDKLTHPDVIAGIISLVSMGPNDIVKASAISWGVNLLEVLNDVFRRQNYPAAVPEY
jgi:hypothetical protein